jgi:DUF1680 family protein
MSHPTSLPLAKVRLDEGFLAERARLVRDTVIPWQWEALNDRIPGAERSGCVHNLQVAAGEKEGSFHGLFWQDSDIAKWIEAASYRLATHPDTALDAELDRIIATIAKAQCDDGYLNTWFQLVEPEKRWSNLRDCHELYVAGHFIEAGVAHFEATGKRMLLDIVCKLADMIGRTFGSGAGQIPGYCGHEEIELALVKLLSGFASVPLFKFVAPQLPLVGDGFAALSELPPAFIVSGLVAIAVSLLDPKGQQLLADVRGELAGRNNQER